MSSYSRRPMDSKSRWQPSMPPATARPQLEQASLTVARLPKRSRYVEAGRTYVLITVVATAPGVLAPSLYSPLGAVSPKTAWYIPWSSVVTSNRKV